MFLKTSRDGDSSTALDRLCQCLTTSFRKKFAAHDSPGTTVLSNPPEELALAQEQEQLPAPGTTPYSQPLAKHPTLASGLGTSQHCAERFLCGSSSFRLGELQGMQRWGSIPWGWALSSSSLLFS